MVHAPVFFLGDEGIRIRDCDGVVGPGQSDRVDGDYAKLVSRRVDFLAVPSLLRLHDATTVHSGSHVSTSHITFDYGHDQYQLDRDQSYKKFIKSLPVRRQEIY